LKFNTIALGSFPIQIITTIYVFTEAQNSAARCPDTGQSTGVRVVFKYQFYI